MHNFDHIAKEDALLYVWGKLPKEKSELIKMHIDSCKKCLAYITYLEHKRIEACKRMENLFEKAFKDKLEKEDARFWDIHIIYCDKCLEKYKNFIQMKKTGLFQIFMGYIRDFVSLPMYVPNASPVLSAESQDNRIYQAFRDIKSLSKKGVDIVFMEGKRGELKAYLKSNKFNVSGVTISIAHLTGRGYKILCSATTGKKGIASLGNIKRLPKPKGKTGFAVIISGAKKGKS